MDVPTYRAETAHAAAGHFPGLDVDELRRYVVVGARRIAARGYLFRSGQAFHGLYLVATGCLETCELSKDGREQVTGFRTPGDLMGVGAIGLDRYTCDAIAIQDSSVWELPYPGLLRACRYVPTLSVALASAMAEEIRQDGAWLFQIGIRSAEYRVARFVLNMSERLERFRSDGCGCRLRFRRGDIANYLSLTRETVSRVLTRLARLGYVSLRGRDVRVRDRVGLAEFVHAEPGAMSISRTARRLRR